MTEDILKSLYKNTTKKQNIDNILYNTYSSNNWNPDFESIPIQIKQKYMNNVVRNVIKNPDIAINDNTYANIFNNCIKNIKKQCKISFEQIEPFCKKYVTEVLKLDKKYIPQIMAILFDINDLYNSADFGTAIALDSMKAINISCNKNFKTTKAILSQKTFDFNKLIPN